MRCTARRHIREDEEPELETVDLTFAGGCRSCGWPTHETAECPNVPVLVVSRRNRQVHENN